MGYIDWTYFDLENQTQTDITAALSADIPNAHVDINLRLVEAVEYPAWGYGGSIITTHVGLIYQKGNTKWD